MTLHRNRLYFILFIACIAGYIWLYLNIVTNLAETKSVEVCLIKHATNISCPSCGSTRSVVSLTKGNFADAFNLNPMGYLIAIILLIAPIWIITDLILGGSSLFNWYQKMENGLKKPKYAIPLVLLVLINWIWNITKGL